MAETVTAHLRLVPPAASPAAGRRPALHDLGLTPFIFLVAPVLARIRSAA